MHKIGQMMNIAGSVELNLPDNLLTPLPDWIIPNTENDDHHIRFSLKPLYCTNCKHTWYPKIKIDGTILVPGTCPVCRTKAWRKIR